MRLAVVVGHRQGSQGAVAVDGVTEWRYHRVLADQVAAAATQAGHDVRVFLRPDRPGYSDVMAELTTNVNGYQPDLVLALHFDSAPDPKWHGTTALHWPTSRQGRMWAIQLAAAVATSQGTRSRGARAQAASWSGAPLYILGHTTAPAVILETHFGSHRRDHERATAARDSGAVASAIVGLLT